MPCYYPLLAVQPYPGAPLELFHRDQEHLRTGRAGKHLEVPCGQCSGCRRRRSLEWAMRCEHEKQQHYFNSYITLTIADEHLAEHGAGLNHRYWQLFMKALRNRLSREIGNFRHGREAGSTLLYMGEGRRSPASMGLRPIPPAKQSTSKRQIAFYMAGEYTEPNIDKGYPGGRPHYHALLFGVDFKDKLYHGRTKAGEKIYRSATLEKLWPYGYSSIGEVTFASAAYIARYVMKKRTGDKNKTDYEILDLETGEIVKKKKEYNCMSRNPGIAKNWFDKYGKTIYTTDYVVTKNGRKLKPPRYYDKQLKKFDRALLEHTKHVRELAALAQAEHHTPERLAVQEVVATAKAKNQHRNLE